ncbi:hypothetical protein TNIN_34261 [Trichonephila inaurata madagascariensis]|uniref:Uncharacterized protein n=1 Tax=Trichonephila inaurata madagascariensis TaxID=2747483 RepID=A0A8X6WTH5_9ARAC|nr:hypothetical protein TNIN_34261 [Trichonephila inaurata madagascariensis]
MSRRPKYDYIEDLLSRLENGDTFLKTKRIWDNEDDHENPPLTMEEGLLGHLYNPSPGPSNCQPHSCLLGVSTWRQRSRERSREKA